MPGVPVGRLSVLMLFSACAFWRLPPQQRGAGGVRCHQVCMFGRCSPCCITSATVETAARATADGQVAALGAGFTASASRRFFIIKCAFAANSLPAEHIYFSVMRCLVIKLPCGGVAMCTFPATRQSCKCVMSLRCLRIVASVQMCIAGQQC